MKVWHQHWGARLLMTAVLAAVLAGAPAVLAQGSQAAAKPKPGGNVTVRLSAVPECLDMYKATSTIAYQASYPVLDTLLTLNAKGKPIPYLAKSYKVSKDGKTLTFTLRKDVKYSNGRTLTAADVKADLQRVLDPATKSPVSLGYLGPVSKITTSGKFVVKLQYSEPNRAALTYLAYDYLGIMDPRSVTAAGTNTCNGLVGSGAYKISNVGPGISSVKEVRNKYHTFGPSWASNKGPGYLNSLTFMPIVSGTTAVSELLNGQLDITDVAGTDLSRVQGNKKFQIIKAPSIFEDELIFNVTKAPFNNEAVRRAVAEAIDRKALLTASIQGLGKVSTSFLPSSNFGYDPASSKYAPKLNPSAARAAISAAHATGPYTLLTIPLGGLDTAAEIIQGELGQAGMQINVTKKSVADWLTSLEKGDFDIALVHHGSFDPGSLYRYFHSSQRNGGLNFLGVDDPTLDKYVLSGRTSLNLKKAKTAYLKAQKLIMGDKVYVDPLYEPYTIFAVNKRVHGVKINQVGAILWQDVWVKK